MSDYRRLPFAAVTGAVLFFAAATGQTSPVPEALRPPLPWNLENAPVIDEIDLGKAKTVTDFEVFPADVVLEQRQVFDRSCLLLPDSPNARDRYIAVRLGGGKGLKAGGTYLLEIEYPEDQPRSMIVWNAGNETRRGFHTGTSLGDALEMPYVYGNPESLNYPLAGRWETWRSVFELHPRFSGAATQGPRDQTPEDGILIAVAHYRHAHDPASAGLAVGRIRLRELKDTAALTLKLPELPEGLPQRYNFWREEMSDNIVFDKKNPAFEADRGADWFEAKMRLAKFLGVNTFSRDLLEFGHNQGWDSSKFGSNDWVYQSSQPWLWSQVVERAGRYGLNILPMYEYCGSIGGKLALGPQKRCKTLAQAGKGPDGRDDYTHIHWSEKGNADVTDPDTVEDLRKMLEITVADEKDKANFIGAWLRPRNSGMPVSFSDRCLQLFAGETNQAETPTRKKLQDDKALNQKYLDWWLGKRHDFLTQIRDYLRQPDVIGPDAVMLFTGDPSEPGAILSGGGIVTDDPARFPGKKTVTPETVLAQRLNWKGLTEPRGTWGGWEWQYSVPVLDPLRYRETPGVMMTLAFSRQYSVADAATLEAFSTPDGLAIIRHYPLNEHCFGQDGAKPLGYFAVDFEEAGPYSMLAEARALANGDPRFIGYMTANSMQRGFPEYVRAFNRAFLALPALPSRRLPAATASDQEVVVREIPTPKNGTWYAIINTSMNTKRDVRVNLPGNGALRDVLSELAVDKTAPLSLYPGQVQVWHTLPNATNH